MHKLSQANKNLIETARLGLLGEKDRLRDFLQRLAVHEINKNHHEVYNSIMSLLTSDDKGFQTSASVVSSGVKKDNYHVDIKKVWLAPSVEKRISRILKYFKVIEKKLDEPKLNKILLYGPPGTGKTTLGFYIAKQLDLPTRYIKVTDVISSRLGETMKNIADIFNTPGKEIIFIDEFDAFAKTRQDTNDVGELKRIVNSIIQTLDFSAKEKIVIVATNLVETIDPAILRRFSFKIEVGNLTESEKKDFFLHLVENGKHTKSTLSTKESDFLFSIFSLLGLDTIDSLRSVIEKAKMEMLLADRDQVVYKDFIDVLLFDGYLSGLKKIKTQNERLLVRLFQEVERVGYSKTSISSMLGVHRNTYPKYSSKK